ncbi:S-adenosyl-L-methionine-dependent methyltransferase [Chlamydoabsidia padenii]|nr:S-adenosyl-L-methionine-dependent methyltransferase [Chlamydoabsidia padenii]
MGQQSSKKILRQSRNKETTSLPSLVVTTSNLNKGSVFRYKEGRRYHEDASIPYFLPNDDEECDRAHQQHWLFRYLFQSNFEVPLHKELEKGNMKVLDSGCGPGTWLFDMAEDYPLIEFFGIDMSPVFPQGVKPSNVTFALANMTESLPYPDHHFDYIHQRLLLFGLTAPQWDLAIQELLRVLKPGGWIEFVEVDIDVIGDGEGPLYDSILDAIVQMMISRNMIPDISKKLVGYMEKYHLNPIHTTVKEFPMRHGGKLGNLFWDNFQQIATALYPIVCQTHPEWASYEDYQKFLSACGEECTANQITVSIRKVWAQKPCAPIN